MAESHLQYCQRRYDERIAELTEALDLEYGAESAESRLTQLCEWHHQIQSCKELAIREEVDQLVSGLPKPAMRVSGDELAEYLGWSDRPPAYVRSRAPEQSGAEFKMPTEEDPVDYGSYRGDNTVVVDHYGILKQTAKAVCVALEPPYYTDRKPTVEAAWFPIALCQNLDTEMLEVADFFDIKPIQYG